MSIKTRAPTTLLILALMGFQSVAMAQSGMPVIVRQPKVEPLKNFTNWRLIKVTYTVEYLDGYLVLLDRAKPNMMNFSPFEADPKLGQELIKINEYRYQGDPHSKGANYFDLVYYLRHIGEKKGDILLPEQVFEYVEVEPGKPLAGLKVQLAKAPGVLLRYDSTLTKNADDIIDDIDFGSSEDKENFWKYYVSFGGFAVSLLVMLLLIFKRPSARKLTVAAAGTTSERVKTNDGVLAPPEVLRAFLCKLETLNNRGILCNELRRLLLAYVPGMLESDTVPEMQEKIVLLESGPAKEIVNYLVNWLENQENILYENSAQTGVPSGDLKTIGGIAEKLKPSKLFWLIMKARRVKAKNSALDLFRKIRRLGGRP